MTPKQLMVRDGAPAALFLTPATRARAWEGVSLRSIPLFQVQPKDESDETKAFRAQEDERRRLKSLASIGKMKARMATKAIDYSKVRWDAMKCKFVPLEGTHVARSVVSTVLPPVLTVSAAKPGKATVSRASDPVWSRVNRDTAVTLARLNGVWDDKYAKLSGGLLVMTVTNRLKGLVKKGGEVKWQ